MGRKPAHPTIEKNAKQSQFFDKLRTGFNGRTQNTGDRSQKEKIENKANLGKAKIGVSSFMTSK